MLYHSTECTNIVVYFSCRDLKASHLFSFFSDIGLLQLLYPKIGFFLVRLHCLHIRYHYNNKIICITYDYYFLYKLCYRIRMMLINWCMRMRTKVFELVRCTCFLFYFHSCSSFLFRFFFSPTAPFSFFFRLHFVFFRIFF